MDDTRNSNLIFKVSVLSILRKVVLGFGVNSCSDGVAADNISRRVAPLDPLSETL